MSLSVFDFRHDDEQFLRRALDPRERGPYLAELTSRRSRSYVSFWVMLAGAFLCVFLGAGLKVLFLVFPAFFMLIAAFHEDTRCKLARAIGILEGRSRCLLVDPKDPDPAHLERAAEVLGRGGVLAYPTETLYGLGVDPFREDALEKLFLLKGRPPNQPVSVLVRDMEMLEEVARDISPDARRVLEAFLPGPLTAVLRARPHLPGLLTAGTDKIGVRISSHPLLPHLFERYPQPITTTSANRTGLPAAVAAWQIADSFSGGIDCILDGGPVPGGAASTVVDLTGDEPVILREGSITLQQMLRVLG